MCRKFTKKEDFVVMNKDYFEKEELGCFDACVYM
jgi:hypothetical protein